MSDINSMDVALRCLGLLDLANNHNMYKNTEYTVTKITDQLEARETIIKLILAKELHYIDKKYFEELHTIFRSLILFVGMSDWKEINERYIKLHINELLYDIGRDTKNYKKIKKITDNTFAEIKRNIPLS